MRSDRLVVFFTSHFWILLHTAMVLGPLLAFSAILLGLVYFNLWDKRQDKPTDLSLSSGYLSDTLYVAYSATSLILVASWSSSVAIPLVRSLLTLTSYPVAAHMMMVSDRNLTTLLPTASQLGLIIELLDGRKTALLTWFRTFWRRDDKLHSLWMIELPVGVQLAGVALSIAIVAADTWLHIATSSTTMWYLANVDPQSYALDHAYSRQVIPGCLDTPGKLPCSITVDQDTNTNTTLNPQDVKTLMTYSHTTSQVNSSAGDKFFLAPRLPNRDRSLGKDNIAFQTFTATTEAAQISCDRNLSICAIDGYRNISQEWNYSCPAGMSGTLTEDSKLSIGSWYQPRGTQNRYNDMWMHYNTSTFSTIAEFGLVAFLNNVTVKKPSGSEDTNDTMPVSASSNGESVGILFAIQCNATFTRQEYDWTNSTTQPSLISTGTSIAAIAVRSRLFAGYFDGPNFDQSQKTKILDHFPRDRETSVGELVQQAIGAVGLVSMSLLGGTIEPAPAKALRIGRSTIVTEVRKAPLVILVMLNLWYAAFAAILGALVIYIMRDQSFRQDIIEVQKLLTINGLATSAIGRHEECLEDADTRVCVQKINGKWRFRVLGDADKMGQAKTLMGPEPFTEQDYHSRIG